MIKTKKVFYKQEWDIIKIRSKERKKLKTCNKLKKMKLKKVRSKYIGLKSIKPKRSLDFN